MDNNCLEECCICGKKLKPICETKHHEGKCYCIECYKEKYFLAKLKKLREQERI